MPGIEFDTSELRALAADLTRAGELAPGKVRLVVSKGALNVKNQLVEEMRSSTHFKGVAESISYDLHGGSFFGVGVIEAEIGPRSGSGESGNLANIASFGSSRGGGTVADPQRALDAEAPRFEKALADVLVGLLL